MGAGVNENEGRGSKGSDGEWGQVGEVKKVRGGEVEVMRSGVWGKWGRSEDKCEVGKSENGVLTGELRRGENTWGRS